MGWIPILIIDLDVNPPPSIIDIVAVPESVSIHFIRGYVVVVA